MIHVPGFARGIIAVTTTVATVRLFSLANQIVITRTFGVSAEMDAYQAALFFPDLVSMTFGGVIQVLFVPAFVRALARGDRMASDRVFSSILNLVLLIFGLIVALSVVGAPLVVRLTAPGFTDDRLAMTVDLARFLYPLAVGQVGLAVLNAALDGRKMFIVSNLAGACVPASMMLVLHVLSEARYGVVVLAIGQLVGLGLQLTVLALAVRAAGIQYQPILTLRSPELQSVIRELPSVLASQILVHSTLVADQLVLSTLPDGELAAFNYSRRILWYPVGMVFEAFSRTSLPYFADHVGRQDWDRLRETTRGAVWSMIVLCGAMTIGAWFLSEPIIGLMFERGRFTAEDTQRVSWILMMSALGLIPMGLSFVIPRVFNALQQNHTLMWITVIRVSLNAVLNLTLAPILGAAGVALATTIVYMVTTAVQIVALRNAPHGFYALGEPPTLRAIVQSTLNRILR